MDRSHPIVQKISSFLDSYRLFQTLGLRHLPVVDDEFQVVGIVTRHDLLDYWLTEKHDSIHLGLETGI
jgi:chloride channel 7